MDFLQILVRQSPNNQWPPPDPSAGEGVRGGGGQNREVPQSQQRAAPQRSAGSAGPGAAGGGSGCGSLLVRLGRGKAPGMRSLSEGSQGAGGI